MTEFRIEPPGASGNRVAFAYRANTADRPAHRGVKRRPLYHDLALLCAGILTAALVLA